MKKIVVCDTLPPPKEAGVCHESAQVCCAVKLLDDVIRDLDESSCSNKKAEAMQFLRAAKEILEAEGR